MRNYGKIAPAFWKRGSGKRLRGKPGAQVLALYLMTCEQGTACGLFNMSVTIMSHETGLTPKQTEDALAVLAAEDLAHLDEDAELVWVPGTALHQVGAELKPGDKRRIGILEELRRCGSHRFVADFYARYGTAFSLPPPPPSVAKMLHARPLEGASDGPSEPLGSQYNNSNSTDQSLPDSAAPKTLLPPVSEPVPQDAKPKRGGRAARSLCPEDWQPLPKDREAVVSAGLDADAIVHDFVNYWRAEGKLMADWNAAFRNNVSRIQRTDFLKVKYAAPAPVPRAAAAPAEEKHGAPVPPPADLAERMRRFARGDAPSLAEEPQTSVRPVTREEETSDG